MSKEIFDRNEVIMAGLGGSGILTAGILLAEAAAAKYRNVTWFPSYAISKRGGLCECTIIFSNDEIASPLLSRAHGIIITEAAQFEDFVGRVRLGGTIIVEKAGLQSGNKNRDIRVIEVSAIEIAISLASTSQCANMVLLGAYVEATQAIPAELIRREIIKTFNTNKKVKTTNLQAFEKGRSVIRNE